MKYLLFLVSGYTVSKRFEFDFTNNPLTPDLLPINDTHFKEERIILEVDYDATITENSSKIEIICKYYIVHGDIENFKLYRDEAVTKEEKPKVMKYKITINKEQKPPFFLTAWVPLGNLEFSGVFNNMEDIEFYQNLQ